MQPPSPFATKYFFLVGGTTAAITTSPPNKVIA
jgi:hypothetical protein